jgi:hypothetical protein
MHPNFYHWHSRVEFKAEAEIAFLEKRWKAANEAVEKVGSPEVQSLLRLVLFPGAEPEFAKKFSNALVKLEPAFPPEGNAELLRVMATAVVYEALAETTNLADAFALGIHASAFGPKRIEPVCKDIIERAHEYLTAESERMRPAVDTSRQDKLEDETKAQLEALKKAKEEGDQEKLEAATVELSSKLVETLDCYRDQWERHMEESQFLWWLVGRRSSQLKASRQTLTVEQYAFPAAVEAAERVKLLPPAPSIEPLLHEVLSQCAPQNGDVELEQIIAQVDPAWAKGATKAAQLPELTPVSSLIGAKAAGTKADQKFWKQLRVPQKTKIKPAEASAQYFRELMFLQALKRLV